MSFVDILLRIFWLAITALLGYNIWKWLKVNPPYHYFAWGSVLGIIVSFAYVVRPQVFTGATSWELGLILIFPIVGVINAIFYNIVKKSVHNT